MSSTSCADCGKQVNGLLEISEYAGLVQSQIADGDGQKRSCLAPSFTNIRDVCYPCYRIAARKEIEKAKAI